MSEPCPHQPAREATGVCPDSFERLDEFARHLEEICWILDARTRKVLYVSPAYEKIWGKSREEVYRDRSTSWANIHPEDRERVVAAIPKQELGTFNEEFRVIDARGSVRWMRSRAYPVRDASGVVVRIMGISAEITDMKSVHERMVNSERLSALGALAAGIGHEISNPLSYAIQFAECLEEELAKPGMESLAPVLRNVLEGLSRIRQVTQGLKLFARQEESSERVFNLQKTIECSLAMAMSEIRSRAQVKCVLLSDAEMLGNEAKIGQVILNLLVNAAQAIEAAGGMGHQIAIEMRRPQRGDVIIVQVSDTGEGIPEEIIGRIFDPFFTTKPVGVGTGLGLSICKDTIESMGGRIEVRSAPGAGTTFTLRLPVKKPAESKPVEGVAPAVTSSNPTGKICLEQPRKPSILIVEDETALASALQLMLKKQYMVNVLGNGLEAYERLKEGPLPELILCDLMMPGMTGMELYGKLRGSRPECEKHFVFMTGGAFTEAARTFLAGVPCPQLSKPFDRSTLLKVLEETASSGSAAPSH